MAALMGGIPIAMGIGAGAEARQPLGLTVVGGLLVSQLVTLYITPVFYIYLERIVAKFYHPHRQVAMAHGGVGHGTTGVDEIRSGQGAASTTVGDLHKNSALRDQVERSEGGDTERPSL